MPGDIAHQALRDVYARLLPTLQQYTDAPVLCVAGNHDVLDIMQMVNLPIEPIILGDWMLVGFDSHEDEAPSAKVEQTDLAKFTRHVHLHPQAQHLLMATHHPVFEIGCPWLDRDRIQQPVELVQQLFNMTDKRLRGVVFGHIHQEAYGVVDLPEVNQGIPAWAVPSTCFQFAPQTQNFAIDDKNPGYRWLQLHEDGRITSQVERVTN